MATKKQQPSDREQRARDAVVRAAMRWHAWNCSSGPHFALAVQRLYDACARLAAIQKKRKPK